MRTAKLRGVDPARVLMVPMVLVPNVAPGLPKLGVFVRLYASNRACSRYRSWNLKSLKMEQSKWRNGGPFMILRPSEPIVPMACGAKAAGLNHCRMVGFDRTRLRPVIPDNTARRAGQTFLRILRTPKG